MLGVAEKNTPGNGKGWYVPGEHVVHPDKATQRLPAGQLHDSEVPPSLKAPVVIGFGHSWHAVAASMNQ